MMETKNTNSMKGIEREEFIDACRSNNIPMIELAIHEKVDVNMIGNHNRIPLHYVTSRDAAVLLVDHGADIHAKDEYGNTPIKYAQKPEIADVLFERGADIHTRDNEGRTAYFNLRKKDVGLWFLKKGLDILAKDNTQHTALHEVRNAEVAEFLVDNGISIHSFNLYLKNALHYASHRGREDVVNFLLERGADINYKDSDGNTAGEYAVTRGMKSLFYTWENKPQR